MLRSFDKEDAKELAEVCNYLENFEPNIPSAMHKHLLFSKKVSFF
jgi:hypothetical protein